MEKRTLMSTYLEDSSPTRLIQGLVVGIVGTVAIGFAFAGWQLGGNVDEKVNLASQSATVTALAPICAERFQAAALTDSTMVPELAGSRVWERDTMLIEAGWVTFPGAAGPNGSVAESCAQMLSKTYKLDN